MGTATNPPSLHCQLFYNLVQSGQDQSGGFSEGFYYNGVDLEVAASAVTSLQQLRMAMLASDVSFVGARITNPANPRKVRTVSPLDQGIVQTGTFTYAGDPAVQATTSLHPELALLVKFTTQEYDAAYHYVHCIPANLYDPPMQMKDDDANWTAAFAAWVTELKAQFGTTTGSGATKTYKPIKAVTPLRITERKIGRVFHSFVGRRTII